MSDFLWYLQPLNCQSLLKISSHPVMLNLTQPDMGEKDEEWGITYSTLWHSYKTFIGVTRPNSLLKWVLDIRDQCFLVHVITHGALSAIFSTPVAQGNNPFGAQRLSSNPAPTSTDLLHLHSALTIAKLPTLEIVTHGRDLSLKKTSHKLKWGPRSSKNYEGRWILSFCSSYMHLAVRAFASRHLDYYKSKTDSNDQDKN